MIGTSRTARDPDNPSPQFYPLATAGCCILVGGMIAAAVIGSFQNREAAERENAAVRSALSREVHTIGDRLRAFAAVTPLPAPNGPYSAVSGPFPHLYLFDPLAKRPARAAADPVLEALAGVARANLSPQQDGLRGPLEPADDGAPAGVPAGDGIHADMVDMKGGAYLAVVMGATRGRSAGKAEGGRPVDLIALQPMDDAVLARIARDAGTRPIAIAPRDAPDEQASLDLPAAANGTAIALAWVPDHPGDRMLRAVGAVLGSLGIALAAAVLLLSHRQARRLAASEARAKADATHDTLTGLPNRTAFARNLQREVERAASGNGGFGLIYLHIDRFKEINDTHGHGAGDVLIVTAARRIAKALRAGSHVARIGGDEFAVLVSDLRDPKDCAELARRILALFAEPVELGDNKTASATVSIGIALCPHDARTVVGITDSADLALYRAKNEGRNRFAFFEKRMGEALLMRKTVEDDLRAAIANDQLVMDFQPVLSLDGRRMVGVEALVRWRHPTQGTISPASFITLAEECGLILPLGEWVLRHALNEARRWPGLRVAVNVSAIQFRQKDFVQSVQTLLDESGIEPSQLELELTESVLLADADQAEDAMIELRAMGVRLALDDFGTGYSSLIYLRRFAFDKIKIDKSFLESTESTGESAIIVHSIVHLGRALGLTVTAEGVETQDQHRFLQALGCHELQGFLFSPPVPATEIDRMLRRDDAARKDESRFADDIALKSVA